MGLIRKIIAGGPRNRSRLHSQKGNRITLPRAVINAPRSLATWAIFRTCRTGPALPWLCYSAISRLDQLIRPTDDVMEFGSGSSTLWFSRHAASVTSVESSPEWHARVSSKLAKAGATNARCTLAISEIPYVNAGLGARYDVLSVDGFWRLKCFEKTKDRLRESPLIIIDDTDKDSGLAGGEMRALERAVEEFAAAGGLVIERFTDFSPMTLFVKETLLAYDPRRRARIANPTTTLEKNAWTTG